MPQQMPEWAGQAFVGGYKIVIFPEHFHCGIQTILLFFWADKSVQLFYFASWLAHAFKESLFIPKCQIVWGAFLSLFGLFQRKFPQKLILAISADLNQHHLRVTVCYN